jgi:hypothetical protein
LTIWVTRTAQYSCMKVMGICMTKAASANTLAVVSCLRYKRMLCFWLCGRRFAPGVWWSYAYAVESCVCAVEALRKYEGTLPGRKVDHMTGAF